MEQRTLYVEVPFDVQHTRTHEAVRDLVLQDVAAQLAESGEEMVTVDQLSGSRTSIADGSPYRYSVTCKVQQLPPKR